MFWLSTINDDDGDDDDEARNSNLTMVTIPLRITLTGDRAVNVRSRSFKVIEFCCNRKPICDFLLVINCHLNSISHCFRDITSRSRSKITPPQFEPPIEGNLSNFLIKLGTQIVKDTFYWKLHDHNFSRFVTIHSPFRKTDRRQTRVGWFSTLRCYISEMVRDIA